MHRALPCREGIGKAIRWSSEGLMPWEKRKGNKGREEPPDGNFFRFSDGVMESVSIKKQM